MIDVEAVLSAGRSPPGYGVKEPVGFGDVLAGDAEDRPPSGEDVLSRGDHVLATLRWYLAQRSGRKRSREADRALQGAGGGPATKQAAIPARGRAEPAVGAGRTCSKTQALLPGEVSEAPADLLGGHPL